MKIVHAADLHIDSPMVGIERYPGVPADRLRIATREAFQHLVTLTLKENASILLLAGDLFDDNWRDYATGLFFLNELGRLRETKARVVIVRGNHDAQSHVTRNLTLPDFVTELSSKKPETRVFDELGVAVHGQSYGLRETKDDLAVRYPSPVSGLVNIGLLHTSLDGREGHASYAPTSLRTLIAKGYDYWALGHVHAREVVSRDPFIVFPGNLQGRNARETGEKGASVITVTDGIITDVEHRALDVVRWHVLRIDAAHAEDSEATLALIARALGETARNLDSRVGVARIIVSAGPRLLGRLLASEEAFVGEVRARANDVAEDALCAERVLFVAAPVETDGTTGATPGPSEAPPLDDAFIARVRERLRELSARLPEASKRLFPVDDDATLRELGSEAWALVERALREDEP